MKPTKVGRFVVAAVIVAAGLFSLLLARGHPRDYRMRDGSIMHIEKVTYGKLEHINLGGPLQRLKAVAPAFLKQRLPSLKVGPTTGYSWLQVGKVHTNDDALYIYISRRGPTNSVYRSVDARFARLIDDHGCVYLPTQSGGEDTRRLFFPALSSGAMPYTVGWFRFEAFPRRQAQFRLQVLETPGHVWLGATNFAEFVIANPCSPPRSTNWPVETFPIAKSNGPVTFILSGVKIETNSNHGISSPYRTPRQIAPEFQIFEDGRPSTNWQSLDTELFDSSGNFASEVDPESRILCTNEPAWKLRAKFFGTEESASASNTIWTLRALVVPAEGHFISFANGAALGTNFVVALQEPRELQGVRVELVAFTGVGEFDYSRQKHVTGGPLTKSLDGSYLVRDYTGMNRVAYSIQATQPSLVLDPRNLSDDQRLSVRLTDGQGRHFYGREIIAYPWGKVNAQSIKYLRQRNRQEPEIFLTFDLPSDVTTVDLTICVHGCVTPEFIFKPPTGPESALAVQGNDPKGNTNISVRLIRATDEGHIVHK